MCHLPDRCQALFSLNIFYNVICYHFAWLFKGYSRLDQYTHINMILNMKRVYCTCIYADTCKIIRVGTITHIIATEKALFSSEKC